VRNQVAGFVLAALAIVGVIIALMFLVPTYGRYQKRANAQNQVKVSAIQIQNQEQRVKIAKQHAQIRFQNSIGIREAQDEIAKTLTPLYVQFEMTQALQAIATSGKNNSVIYIPTSPTSGLPVVPTSNTTPPVTK
jgi:type II secretory pathway pseudopilin PulG